MTPGLEGGEPDYNVPGWKNQPVCDACVRGGCATDLKPDTGAHTTGATRVVIGIEDGHATVLGMDGVAEVVILNHDWPVGGAQRVVGSERGQLHEVYRIPHTDGVNWCAGFLKAIADSVPGPKRG